MLDAGKDDKDDECDEVLDDENADADASVESIKVVFVGKKFDDDDGAAEGECEAEVEGGNGGYAECADEKESEEEGGEDLGDAEEQCEEADFFEDFKVEVDADDEEEEGDADLCECGKGVGWCDKMQKRWAECEAGCDVGDNEWLFEKAGDNAKECDDKEDSCE